MISISQYPFFSLIMAIVISMNKVIEIITPKHCSCRFIGCIINSPYAHDVKTMRFIEVALLARYRLFGASGLDLDIMKLSLLMLELYCGFYAPYLLL